ncbi:MAG: TlpA disulfide reductase family protein [bacterium]|nr:TlpA disulfide reductase family protein [bacterium]
MKETIGVKNLGWFVLAMLGTLLSIVAAPAFAHAISDGDKAPNFELASLAGQNVSLSQFRGKIVYLDFWASWCGPCRHTLPWMEELQRKFAGKGLVVVAVNLDKNKSDAQKAISGIHPSYQVLLDPNGTVPAKYMPPKMPTSFLIGRDGTVVSVHAGFKDGEAEEIESEIARMLSGK